MKVIILKVGEKEVPFTTVSGACRACGLSVQTVRGSMSRRGVEVYRKGNIEIRILRS